MPEATMTVEAAERVLRYHAMTDRMLRFTRALVEAGAFLDFDQITYYLEKPWTWAPEFSVWSDHGGPSDDSEPGWSEFLAAVELG